MTSDRFGSRTEDSELRAAGIHDVEFGAKAIHDLAGGGVTDDDLQPLIPHLLEALRECPDPDRALSAFARWFSSVGSPYSHLQILIAHPVALRLFCLITGCSQYFANLLANHPEYFEIIANRGVRGGTKSAARFQREAAELVEACIRPELKRDALRRWKAREMLRIGVRDLAGLSDMPSTAREFSNLADSCVHQALAIALASSPALVNEEAVGNAISIVAMGKLGGQELNYSSDIDLMFVRRDGLPAVLELQNGRTIETHTWLTRVCETLIKVLNEETSNGHVFRVDMRLRPEGRFGPLVRSLSSYHAYYESWAESWERQALIKARPIAGDAALGSAFMEMVTSFVYRPIVSEDLIEEVRANKRKIEQKCALEGETETNVKTGYGGIRDVEFTVQLLQLEHGGALPQLRTPNTLSALRQLRRTGILKESETLALSEDYRFLRALEHRLQLLHQFHTAKMPDGSDDRERTFLALRMGFLNRESFEADLRRRRDRVSGLLDKLFYGERPSRPRPTGPIEEPWAGIGDLLDNQNSPAVREMLASRLLSAGFTDIPAALRALELPMSGNEFGGMPPDTPQEFKSVAPRLLELLAASADPDRALAGIEALALAVPNRAQLYASMDDSPEFMARLVRLAAASPHLMQRLCRRLEWMEGLAAETEGQDDSDRGQGAPTILRADRIRSLGVSEQNLEVIARYYLRETLRIGARDIWDWDSPADTMRALSRLAETVLSTLMTCCAETIAHSQPDAGLARQALSAVAAIGLGKLGGAELGYASDWDLVFVYREDSRKPGSQAGESSTLAQRLAEGVIGALRLLETYGVHIELDLRLRPWGKKGALLLTPRAYIDYFKTSADTWERQAVLKARFVAGNPALGRRMERIFHAVSVGRGATPSELAEIRAMKRRIERERLKPAEQETDLKLGFGGLSDIEWLCQFLQMENGASLPPRGATNTLAALSALAEAGALPEVDAALLSETYSLLTRLRNGMWLLSGHAQDVLSDRAQRRVLARRLGFEDTPSAAAEDRLWEHVRAKMRSVRHIFERTFPPPE